MPGKEVIQEYSYTEILGKFFPDSLIQYLADSLDRRLSTWRNEPPRVRIRSIKPLNGEIEFTQVNEAFAEGVDQRVAEVFSSAGYSVVSEEPYIVTHQNGMILQLSIYKSQSHVSVKVNEVAIVKK